MTSLATAVENTWSSDGRSLCTICETAHKNLMGQKGNCDRNGCSFINGQRFAWLSNIKHNSTCYQCRLILHLANRASRSSITIAIVKTGRFSQPWVISSNMEHEGRIERLSSDKYTLPNQYLETTWFQQQQKKGVLFTSQEQIEWWTHVTNHLLRSLAITQVPCHEAIINNLDRPRLPQRTARQCYSRTCTPQEQEWSTDIG